MFKPPKTCFRNLHFDGFCFMRILPGHCPGVFRAGINVSPIINNDFQGDYRVFSGTNAAALPLAPFDHSRIQNAGRFFASRTIHKYIKKGQVFIVLGGKNPPAVMKGPNPASAFLTELPRWRKFYGELNRELAGNVFPHFARSRAISPQRWREVGISIGYLFLHPEGIDPGGEIPI